MSEHDKLVEVTRNADEIQTTFIGFLMDGRVIEIGDINHKPNRDNTRRIVTAVNSHQDLVNALQKTCHQLAYLSQQNGKKMGDPRVEESARTLLAALEAEKGGE